MRPRGGGGTSLRASSISCGSSAAAATAVLAKQIKKLGVDRLVFGTTLLMRYAKTTLVALDACDLSKRNRERILWRNLVKLVPEIR